MHKACNQGMNEAAKLRSDWNPSLVGSLIIPGALLTLLVTNQSPTLHHHIHLPTTAMHCEPINSSAQLTH